MGKPVLSLCSGSVPHAELTRRVREMRVGFGYEYAEPDDAALRAFLQSAAEDKAAGKGVSLNPDQAKVLDYRYDNRARRMAEICRAALESKESK